MALETRALAKTLAPSPQDFIDNPQLLADWIYQVTENIAILSANAIVPSGDIKITGGDDVEEDWLLCDGQAVSRDVYSTLFAVIGIKYGAGDGSTTFNLPDFSAFIVGGETFTVIIKT